MSADLRDGQFYDGCRKASERGFFEHHKHFRWLPRFCLLLDATRSNCRSRSGGAIFEDKERQGIPGSGL
jgi:hypothetical protein